MGASVIAYWPGITEARSESQPGFRNDEKAWGDWIAGRELEPAVDDALRTLKAEAILTFKTDGWDDDDVSWVSPQESDHKLGGKRRCDPDDAGGQLVARARIERGFLCSDDSG